MDQSEFDWARVRVRFFSYYTYSSGFRHVQPLSVRKVRQMRVKFIHKYLLLGIVLYNYLHVGVSWGHQINGCSCTESTFLSPLSSSFF